jgi:hypothetical protein
VTERIPDWYNFREFLWDVLPEAREGILFEEMGEVSSYGEIDLSAYRYMSEFRQVLSGAAERGDVPLVRRCIDIVERMLAGGDDLLDDPLQIRVFDKDGLVPGFADLFRAYAGPLTRARLGLGAAPPMPEPLPAVGDGRADASALAVRDWMWDRVPVSRYFLLKAEYDEVRAAMSLGAMTPRRYFFEAYVQGVLDDAAEWARNGNPEPAGHAAAGLRSMAGHPVLAGFAEEVHDR